MNFDITDLQLLTRVFVLVVDLQQYKKKYFIWEFNNPKIMNVLLKMMNLFDYCLDFQEYEIRITFAYNLFLCIY